MDKRTISLTDSNSDWVEAQAGDNADAYVNEVLARDRKRKEAEAELLKMLDEAEASGESEQTAEEIWAEAEAEYLARHG